MRNGGPRTQAIRSICLKSNFASLKKDLIAPTELFDAKEFPQVPRKEKKLWGQKQQDDSLVAKQEASVGRNAQESTVRFPARIGARMEAA